jgi:chromatin segregation and condensation protein Rec8/ScpA/Scc1 (kleisin family)
LRREISEHDEFKEMSYSLKEKEEEMSEIMVFLKEKIHELDQTKHRATFLERELHESGVKMEALTAEHYEAEQRITEMEEMLEK